MLFFLTNASRRQHLIFGHGVGAVHWGGSKYWTLLHRRTRFTNTRSRKSSWCSRTNVDISTCLVPHGYMETFSIMAHMRLPIIIAARRAPPGRAVSWFEPWKAGMARTPGL